MSSNDPLERLVDRFNKIRGTPSASQALSHGDPHSYVMSINNISHLKHLTHEQTRSLPRWIGDSDQLVDTPIPAHAPVRISYLERARIHSSTLTTPNTVARDAGAPPVISSSEFVPHCLITHLMRNKKSGALGVKFVPGQRDRITNMEGAMHTYINPFALVYMHGDYVYKGVHTVVSFPDNEGKQIARKVVLSAFIHPDFEDDQVMVELARLGDEPIHATVLPEGFDVLDVDAKQDVAARAEYDNSLRKHMVAHLVSSHFLPALSTPGLNIISTSAAISLLSRKVVSQTFTLDDVINIFVSTSTTPPAVLSLELLFASALHQARNEFSALEVLCPVSPPTDINSQQGLGHGGYIYTFDPPSIFANAIGAELLNRLHIVALYTLARPSPPSSPSSSPSPFSNMKAYAFNDYKDAPALPLLQIALRPIKHVRVISKKTLFPTGQGRKGTYRALEGTEGAWLVIHNNSDAFGQNIETESPSGSLDGAIGYSSSAAASLRRDHPGLVDFLV